MGVGLPATHVSSRRAFSDGGSTPPASTKSSYGRVGCIGGGVPGCAPSGSGCGQAVRQWGQFGPLAAQELQTISPHRAHVRVPESDGCLWQSIHAFTAFRSDRIIFQKKMPRPTVASAAIERRRMTTCILVAENPQTTIIAREVFNRRRARVPQGSGGGTSSRMLTQTMRHCSQIIALGGSPGDAWSRTWSALKWQKEHRAAGSAWPHGWLGASPSARMQTRIHASQMYARS